MGGIPTAKVAAAEVFGYNASNSRYYYRQADTAVWRKRVQYELSGLNSLPAKLDLLKRSGFLQRAYSLYR
jgi:hypothetical protein